MNWKHACCLWITHRRAHAYELLCFLVPRLLHDDREPDDLGSRCDHVVVEILVLYGGMRVASTHNTVLVHETTANAFLGAGLDDISAVPGCLALFEEDVDLVTGAPP